jgi:trimeric autotransporter adhesin
LPGSGAISSAGNLGIGGGYNPYYFISAGPVTNMHGVVGTVNTHGFVGLYGISSSNTSDGYTSFFYNSGSVSFCYLSNTTSWSCASDARLKTNINPISGPLDKLAQIRGVSFNWQKDAANTTAHLGVVAQDVLKVFPEAVTSAQPPGVTSGPYYALDYSALIGPIISGVNELNARTGFISNPSATTKR